MELPFKVTELPFKVTLRITADLTMSFSFLVFFSVDLVIHLAH